MSGIVSTISRKITAPEIYYDSIVIFFLNIVLTMVLADVLIKSANTHFILLNNSGDYTYQLFAKFFQLILFASMSGSNDWFVQCRANTFQRNAVAQNARMLLTEYITYFLRTVLVTVDVSNGYQAAVVF